MKEHELVKVYGLSSDELLDIINARFRLKVALEGGVAEAQMEKHVARLVGASIDQYNAVDEDGVPDFRIWLKGREMPIFAECKNVRNQSYSSNGQITNYAVETQKTRAAKGDSTSRYYDATHFDVLGVCLGKQTGDWTSFMFILTRNLARHASHKHKLAVMHRVPIPSNNNSGPWSSDLATVLKDL